MKQFRKAVLGEGILESEVMNSFTDYVDTLQEELVEDLECADEVTVAFVGEDKGYILVEGTPFCSWQSSDHGVRFKLWVVS